MTEFKYINYEEYRGRACITLNRPKKGNAMNLALQEELCEALWEADNRNDIHCVILKGAGSGFCSGYDLAGSGKREVAVSRLSASTSVSNTRKSYSFDDDTWQMERAQRFRMALFDMHKPVICQVHGYCLAGGTDLALLCDMVISTDTALFGFPAARDIGSLPNNLWIYHVGPQWAKRLTMTGDLIKGVDAAKIGLVLKAVSEDQLEAEVEKLANRFALIDNDLLSANKRIINLGMELMGARTLQRIAVENDARAHTSGGARKFANAVAKKGIKATLKERDETFGPSIITVNGPDPK